MHENRPIGIFDSGIGGLTVANAIQELLPNETLVYFGDTAHLPYGDKSTTAIQSYAIKICNLLLKHDCKAIVIACNSASAAAFQLVKEYVGTKSLVFNVIDPTVAYVLENYQSKKIGVIGTRRTVASKIYEKNITTSQKNISVASLATPLLAPMIEEGFYENNISQTVIDNYLSDKKLQGINALVLACTHYPLIMKEIQNYYNDNVEVLNSADLVAKTIKHKFHEHKLLASNNEKLDLFYVSDYTSSFEKATKLFFRKKIELKEYKLWE